MRRIRGTLVFGLCLALLFCYAGKAKAGSTLAVGGDAVVSLDFRIEIPTILYLQVGSPGATVDLITFTVANIPGSGAVPGLPSPVPVRVAALVGSGVTVTLEADSSTPLTDGTNNIPFTEISWTGTDDFAAGSTFFTGTTNQPIAQFTGSDNYTGTYTFSYANSTYYPTGTYNGTVTYTLSSP